jgi:hypothetical protein
MRLRRAAGQAIVVVNPMRARSGLERIDDVDAASFEILDVSRRKPGALRPADCWPSGAEIGRPAALRAAMSGPYDFALSAVKSRTLPANPRSRNPLNRSCRSARRLPSVMHAMPKWISAAVLLVT